MRGGLTRSAAVGTLALAGLVLLAAGFGIGRLPLWTQVLNKNHSTPTMSQRSDAMAQTLTIHGKWTIDILNPDRTLVRERVFENALHPDGGNTIMKLISRQSSAGLWRIATLVTDTGGTEHNYLNAEPNDLASYISFNNVTVAGTCCSSTTVQGTVTSTVDGNVTTVVTALSQCPLNQTGCTNGLVYDFTYRTLASGAQIPVSTGQIIQVSVVITSS